MIISEVSTHANSWIPEMIAMMMTSPRTHVVRKVKRLWFHIKSRLSAVEAPVISSVGVLILLCW